MTIIIEAPLAVTATVREYRKRLTGTATFLASVPVRVLEVPVSEAPLAMRAVDPDGVEYRYREFEGRLVRSLRVPTADGMVLVRAAGAQEAMRAFSAWTSRRNNSGETHWPFAKKALRTYRISRAEDWHEVQSTDHAVASARCRETWAGAVCVDGVVYVGSDGPAWIVGAEYRVGGALWEGNDYAVPREAKLKPRLRLVPERSHLNRPDAAWTFAPGELDFARLRVTEGLAKHSLPGRGTHSWEKQQAAPAGSVSGPALPPPPEPGRLRMAELAVAVSAMLSEAGSDLQSLPPGAIRAFADLKEAHQAGVTPDSAPDALEALRAFHALWAAAPKPSYRNKHDQVGPLLDYLGGGERPADEPEPDPARAPGR